MKQRDLEILFEELAGLSSAGEPLAPGLAAAADDVRSPKLAAVMQRMSAQLNKGQTLSNALQESIPDISPYFHALITAGEKSGDLAPALDQCLQEQTRFRVFRAHFVEATVYPALLISFSILIFTAIANYVIPELNAIFVGLGAGLPWLTQTIVNFQELLSPLGLWGVAVIVIGTMLFLAFVPAGQGLLEWAFSGAPGIRDIIHTYYAGQSMRMVGNLVNSGHSVQESTRVAAPALSLTKAKNQLDALSNKIAKGKRLGESLYEVRLVTSFHARTLERAEQRGHLGDALELIADEYERKYDRVRGFALVVFEPFLLMILGIIVGMMITALYLPLFSLPDKIGN